MSFSSLLATKTAKYHTLGCKLNFSETATVLHRNQPRN